MIPATSRVNIETTPSIRFESALAVFAPGTALILAACWCTVRLLAPPPGWTYDAWAYVHRTGILTLLVSVAAVWCTGGCLRFVFGVFDEARFFRHLALSIVAGSIAAFTFILVSPRGARPAAVTATLAFAGLTLLATWLSRRRNGGGNQSSTAPTPMVKLFWSVLGRFVLPAASIAGMVFVVYRVNRDGPLGTDTLFMTGVAGVWMAWQLFFVIGTRTLHPEFRPTAHHVGSLMFSDLLSLLVAWPVASVAAGIVACDVLPRFHVYSDQLCSTFSASMFLRDLGYQAAGLGMTLDGFVTWTVSMTALVAGQGIIEWVLFHAGLPSHGGPAAVIVRRGRQMLGGGN